MKAILLAVAAFLQVGDIITTNQFLSLGGHEGNPLIAWTQVIMGHAWAIPKLLIAAAIILVISRAKTAKPALFIISIYLLVIANNALLISALSH